MASNGKHRLKAFTLAELAIVLGVTGVILGSLWGLVTMAWDYGHREQTFEAVSVVVNNLRQYYGSRLSMDPTVTQPNLMQPLAAANIVPGYLLRLPSASAGCTNTGSMCADTPFGYPSQTTQTDGQATGSLVICNWAVGQTKCDTNAASGNTFAVQLLDQTFGDCIALTSKISSTAGPSGLLDVSINGSNVINGRTLAGTGALPVAASDLNALCTPGSVANKIAFIYRLTAPAN
jgi:hypothetical protein